MYNFVRHIVKILGITAPSEVHAAMARRNAPIMMTGAFAVALFSGMLAFCLITGTPTSVDGFMEAAQESPAVYARYIGVTVVSTIIFVAIGVYSLLYLRKRWVQPRAASVVVVVFAFVMAAFWGIAVSGRTAENQLLMFASIQFLIAGLMVMAPLVSAVYFGSTFAMFCVAVDLSGQLAPTMPNDLAYLAFVDILVSWVLYGVYSTSVERGMVIADKSRRDELTGAKNRHYLRDDFPSFWGRQLFIMLCDIDDFKHFNDDYSHDVGDAVLREFYFALRDVFSDECTYRYGGDEFLIVFPGESEEAFLGHAARCAEMLQKVKADDEEEARLTFSGGYVYGTARDADDFRGMLHEADQNLLAVKQAGKKQVAGGPAATAAR